jgi:hypothetical protein
MSSEIKVTSVKAKDGTSGISIADSSGNVSLSGTLSAGTLGASVVDNINIIGFSGQLSSDLTTDGALFLYDTSTNYIVQGVTQSSGVITFPTAGKYLATLTLHASKQSTTATHFCSGRIYIGSTIVGQTAVLGYNQTGATDMRMQGALSIIVDLLADDTMKVDMSESGTCKIHNGNATRFSVFRIGG